MTPFEIEHLADLLVERVIDRLAPLAPDALIDPDEVARRLRVTLAVPTIARRSAGNAVLRALEVGYRHFDTATVNRCMRDHDAAAPKAYPHVHYFTAPLRAAARSRRCRWHQPVGRAGLLAGRSDTGCRAHRTLGSGGTCGTSPLSRAKHSR